MFSLIISIIAIALAAVLLLTSAFYGGDALTEGTAKAQAAALANEAQQISAGYDLYRVEHNGTAPAAVGDGVSDGTIGAAVANSLVADDYLKAAPQSDWEIVGGVFTTPDVADFVSDDVCGYVNATDNGVVCAAGTNGNVVTFPL